MSEVTPAACGSRSIRRTKAEISKIKAAIYSALEVEHPATVRGLFYVLVSRGVIPKTEAAYKSTVVRLAGEMRRLRSTAFRPGQPSGRIAGRRVSLVRVSRSTPYRPRSFEAWLAVASLPM